MEKSNMIPNHNALNFPTAIQKSLTQWVPIGMIHLMLLFFQLRLQAQTETRPLPPNYKPYKAIVETKDGKVHKAYAYQLLADSILLAPALPYKKGSAITAEELSNQMMRFSVTDIEKISFRKKGKFVKSVVVGTLVGTATGALLGGAGGDAAMGAVYGFWPGLLTGAIIGSTSATFKMKGNKEYYTQNRSKLQKYMFVKP
jgi:hypothetical protein